MLEALHVKARHGYYTVPFHSIEYIQWVYDDAISILPDRCFIMTDGYNIEVWREETQRLYKTLTGQE